jgi:hypothetical protein
MRQGKNKKCTACAARRRRQSFDPVNHSFFPMGDWSCNYWDLQQLQNYLLGRGAILPKKKIKMMFLIHHGKQSSTPIFDLT